MQKDLVRSQRVEGLNINQPGESLEVANELTLNNLITRAKLPRNHEDLTCTMKITKYLNPLTWLHGISMFIFQARMRSFYSPFRRGGYRAGGRLSTGGA